MCMHNEYFSVMVSTPASFSERLQFHFLLRIQKFHVALNPSRQILRLPKHR